MTKAPLTRSRSGRRPVFVILEGGGAKGLGHVGALKAILETPAFDIAGVAGTSAGALAAALFALGLTPDQMVDARRKTHVLQTLDPPVADAPSLLGSGWRGLKALRDAGSGPWGAVMAILALSSVLFCWALAPGFTPVLIGLYALLGLAVARRILKGIARLNRLKTRFDELAARELGLPKGATPTFGDLRTAGRRPLKMVATNITRQRMALFAADTTPDLPLSEAVAASIAIPVVFKSRRIRTGLGADNGHHFADGGLSSNLPAWAFDAERAVTRGALVIAVQISGDDAPKPISGPLDWLMRIVRSAAFGAEDLSLRGIEPSLRIALPLTDDVISLTDFDASFDKIGDVIEASYSASQQRIAEHFIRKEALALFRARALSANKSRLAGSDLRIALVRVDAQAAKTIDRTGGAAALTLEQTTGFGADDTFAGTVPVLGPAFAQAVTTRTPQFGDGGADPAMLETWPYAARRYWKPVRWQIVLPPVEAPDDALILLIIDGDAALTSDPVSIEKLQLYLYEEGTKVLTDLF